MCGQRGCRWPATAAPLPIWRAYRRGIHRNEFARQVGVGVYLYGPPRTFGDTRTRGKPRETPTNARVSHHAWPAAFGGHRRAHWSACCCRRSDRTRHGDEVGCSTANVTRRTSPGGEASQGQPGGRPSTRWVEQAAAVGGEPSLRPVPVTWYTATGLRDAVRFSAGACRPRCLSPAMQVRARPPSLRRLHPIWAFRMSSSTGSTTGLAGLPRTRTRSEPG